MNARVLFTILVALGCSRPTPPPTPSPAPSPPPSAPAPAPSPQAAQEPSGDASPAGLAANELAVESRPRDTILAVGDPAPVFHGVTHDGHTVESTGGPRARVLVVYFYPRDETPGCTREACAFRDAFRAYDEAGADIVGVSTDAPDAHRGFAQHHSLPFGLLADRQGWLANAFGLRVNGGYAPRVTFVIGRDGKVARVFPEVRVDGHADEVLAAVRAAAGR